MTWLAWLLGQHVPFCPLCVTSCSLTLFVFLRQNLPITDAQVSGPKWLRLHPSTLLHIQGHGWIQVDVLRRQTFPLYKTPWTAEVVGTGQFSARNFPSAFEWPSMSCLISILGKRQKPPNPPSSPSSVRHSAKAASFYPILQDSFGPNRECQSSCPNVPSLFPLWDPPSQRLQKPVPPILSWMLGTHPPTSYQKEADSMTEECVGHCIHRSC